MRESFQVGDLVILQHPTYYHEFDGFPALIGGGHARRRAMDTCTGESAIEWCYAVRIIKRPDCRDTDDDVLLVLSRQMRQPRHGEIPGVCPFVQMERVVLC